MQVETVFAGVKQWRRRRETKTMEWKVVGGDGSGGLVEGGSGKAM
jgi:hypothetical protein